MWFRRRTVRRHHPHPDSNQDRPGADRAQRADPEKPSSRQI
jgi:hypothetical protein